MVRGIRESGPGYGCLHLRPGLQATSGKMTTRAVGTLKPAFICLFPSTGSNVKSEYRDSLVLMESSLRFCIPGRQ